MGRAVSVSTMKGDLDYKFPFSLHIPKLRCVLKRCPKWDGIRVDDCPQISLGHVRRFNN